MSIVRTLSAIDSDRGLWNSKIAEGDVLWLCDCSLEAHLFGGLRPLWLLTLAGNG